MPIFSCRHFENKKETTGKVRKISIDIINSHSCANVFKEFST